jgi:hypothetical protein
VSAASVAPAPSAPLRRHPAFLRLWAATLASIPMAAALGVLSLDLEEELDL